MSLCEISNWGEIIFIKMKKLCLVFIYTFVIIQQQNLMHFPNIYFFEPQLNRIVLCWYLLNLSKSDALIGLGISDFKNAQNIFSTWCFLTFYYIEWFLIWRKLPYLRLGRGGDMIKHHNVKFLTLPKWS